jgi:hypothetical protein
MSTKKKGSSAGEKGHALELAVHTIEELILESSPDLREQRPFQIQRRKTITVAGVRHEIDIYVSVKGSIGYDSAFIFECKNWKKPVGKNDMIVFSRKINVAVAQRGYFVAKTFTKHALAEAALDPRITILYATEHPTGHPPPEGFHITADAGAKPYTIFRIRGTTGEKTDPIDVNGKTFLIGGQEMLITEYLGTWMEQLYQDRLLRFQTAHLDEGIYSMPADVTEHFNPGDVILDGKDIESIRLFVEFAVRIVRPTVDSDFEVISRGRVIRLSKVTIRDVVLEPVFVSAIKNRMGWLLFASDS